MERKKAAGTIRNAERSKKRLLEAVGKIITETGFSTLKINHIAAVAGLDKTLIYSHFGGLDKLLEEYLLSQNFWDNIKKNNMPATILDGGRAFSKEAILNHYEFVNNHPEFQKILLWGLSEQRDALKNLTWQQEASGELLFQHITDPYFKDKASDFRSIIAILIAGSYYLNLHATYNGVPFCGIDLTQENGRKKIEESLLFLIDRAYDNL
ncbi:TetR/AcrR family transcriptional regulator [Flavobacterium sp. DG1-102-2]|uniref:TetR/AcrR family transcriptional regulator n=1 Tax=Flavobacterium sp. DG1-102-2 TaxID=3081663 RepID=UPI0029497404|nr:TetR/AcrR family transcriptional regulator [Flavobacterium sp. DG1-102-2]MDV6167133.1 TetR/AcrR family transcriptional regulator [Flavobacterium sp. DG1-102-2]